jgi:hypothetical protein
MENQQFDPNQHKELAKAMITAAREGGLNEKHPAVQKAMIDMHQKVVGLMPSSSDADRSAAILKRGPLVAQNLKNMLPQEQPVIHASDGVDTDPSDSIAEDAVKGAAAGKWLGGVPGAIVGGITGAIKGVASKANLPLANGAAYGASQFVDTVPTGQPSVADKTIQSQNNPQARMSNIGGPNTNGHVSGYIDRSGNPPVLQDQDTPIEEHSNPTREEIDEIAKTDPEGAANLEAQTAQTGGVKPAGTPNPTHQGIYNTTPAPTPLPPGASASTPFTPQQEPTEPPAQVQGGIEPSLPTPNTGSNAQTLSNQATTPISGGAEALYANRKRAQNYASTQTPEAMAAAQKDKGAVLAGQLAGSGQDSVGRNSALSELANLGQNNLKEQQSYGNASNQEANKTELDLQSTQGQAINNANAATTQPRVGATNVLQTQLKNANDNTDFNQIQTALSQVKSLPSDVSQAIWNGDTAKTILALGSMQKQPGESDSILQARKSAVVNLVAALQKHPELRTSNGIIDEGSINNQIVAAKQKNQNNLDIAQKISNIQSGGSLTGQSTPDTTPPPGYALGGMVNEQEDQPGEDADELDNEDAEMSAPEDTLRKAFGFKPKANMIQDEQDAEQTAGPKNVTLADVKVEASAEPATSIISTSTGGSPTPAVAAESQQGEGAGPSTGNTDIGGMITSAAKSRGIDPGDAHALMMTESGGNPNAINHNRNGTSDHGLFQINDSNIHPGEEGMASDPEWNTGRGLDIYKQGLDRWNGDKRMAAYEYHHGARAAEKAGPGVAQQDLYVKRFMSNLPQQQQ